MFTNQFKTKFVSSFVMAALAVATAGLPARNAHAIAGLATANPGMAIAGGVTMGAAALSPIVLGGLGCGVGAAIGAASNNAAEGCGAGAGVGLITSAALSSTAFLIGLILLPDDAAKVAFVQIDQNSFETLHNTVALSAEEAAAFNDELEEANAAAEMVAVEMQQTQDYSVESAKKLWLKYEPTLSTDAFSAVTKVSAYNVLASRSAK